MVLLWGPQGRMIYNDAYAVFAGSRHPQLLGSKVLEGWPEVAEFNAHVMDVVLHQGGTLSFEDQALDLNRDGRSRKAWMNLDYSPVLDESGKPAGVMAIVVETTGKMMAERWHRSERERQIQMFEQSPGFMAMLHGPSHIFELANAGYRQLVGQRDLIGQTVREAFPDLEGQGFFELLDQVYKTGEPFVGLGLKVDLQRPQAEKEERVIDLIYHPIRNPDGEVIGILAQGVDVTERVAAEQASKQNADRFRTLAEALPNHVWTAGPDGLLDWFNPRVYEYSGSFPGELDGDKWASLVHPEDLAEAAGRWREANENRTPYETEFRLLRRDGAYRWYIARAVPIQDAEGNVLQWVGTNTDIDDQKTISQQLLKSETRFKQSQNAAGIGSLELDIETGTVMGSEQLWKIWGLPVQPSHHISVLEALVVPEDAHIRSNPETRRAGTAVPHVEYRIRRPGETKMRWVSRSVEFVFDDGKPVTMFGVMQDITERKEAEGRMSTLAHELEHRIKNILAMVGSIATRTMRDTDLDTARKAFKSRLEALGAVHDILNQARWSDTSLLDVVQKGIEPFERERFSISGPPLPITPKMAIAMGLLVNELGTNAVKYGALSSSQGRVSINWDLKYDRETGQPSLRWAWQEVDGPQVVVPDKRGFGSVLIEKVLGADFGGNFELRYEPKGVSCVLEAPWVMSQ
nr:PAS domain S-box protein [Aestuariivirga litoralis]